MNYLHLQNLSSGIIKLIDQTPFNEKNAIIYDIDDTLIDIEGVPIIPIINSYKYAIKKGIKPIIITARVGTKENIENTLKELKE